MDNISSKHRSWNMSRIRSKDTKAEITVRSLLHKKGFRFRKNVKNLPGIPDIVLPKYKTIIFVHGCFWHRHNGCKYAYTPKSRIEFWNSKFKSNKKRYEKVERELVDSGWSVFIIWECETKNEKILEERINSIMDIF